MYKEIDFAPIVRPTMKEFSNFEEYVTKLEEEYSKDYGMVKIVPPKQWKPRTEDYVTSIEKNIIPSPIEQNLHGKGGIYECLHIIKKSLSVKDYVKKSLPFDSITDGKQVEDVESLFWKNVSFSPPLYGADFEQSLFDSDCLWNLTKIDSLLRKGLDGTIGGINVPYLYMGHWKTLFAWHKEDMDLSAINFLHYGKSKFWYAIPESDSHYLEKMAKLHFADNFGKCSEYLRHKTTVINPYLLKKKFPQVRIHKMEHKAREFIIVFNGCYHHGFNFGFNIAESVNYATKNWLNYFLKAKECKCISGVVKINHMEFYDNLIKNNPALKKDPLIKKFHQELLSRGFDKEKNYLLKLQESKLMQEQQQQNIQHNSIGSTNDLSQDEEKEKPKNSQIIKKKIEKGKKRGRKSNENSKNENSSQLNDQNSSLSDNQQTHLSNLSQKSSRSKRQKQQKAEEVSKQEQNSIEEEGGSYSQQEEDQQNTILSNKTISKNEGSQNSVKKQKDIIEDWFQCEECNKWRRVLDKSVGKKLKRRKQFYCQYITMKCNLEEENYENCEVLKHNL